MCELISKNPNKIFTLQVDPIIRQGIQRYTDEVGVLWLALAEYYIRTPNYEKVGFLDNWSGKFANTQLLLRPVISTKRRW